MMTQCKCGGTIHHSYAQRPVPAHLREQLKKTWQTTEHIYKCEQCGYEVRKPMMVPEVLKEYWR